MRQILSLLMLFALTGCCTIAQIPTQVYMLNDSCEFYLPDYTRAVEARDNCGVKQFYQTPNSGTLLSSGAEILVTIYAEDYAGNVTTMSFDVFTVDETPPELIIRDSTVFHPMAMYQNKNRVFHIWNMVTPYDTLLTYSSWKDPSVIEEYQQTCHKNKSTFIPWDEVSDSHPLKPEEYKSK